MRRPPQLPPDRPPPAGAVSSLHAFPLDPDGIWVEVLHDADARGRPALFLDRDGVIVEEVGYLHRPCEVRLIAGAAHALARVNRAGIPVIVVTNQSGIGRGIYGWDAFAATQARVAAALAAAGARLDMVVACPFHTDHPCRKPNPGMFLRAAARLGCDLARSWVVGDCVRDLAAGRAAGLAGGVHVLSGHGVAERAAAQALAGPDFTVLAHDSIAAIDDFPPSGGACC